MPSPICNQEEKLQKVVESFIIVMDNRVEFPSYNISDDAVMDWFGRSICGRTSIISFTKARLVKFQHEVDEIASVPQTSHRLLKKIKQNDSKKCTAQSGNSHGDSNGQRTPDNPICPNLDELIKAPRGMKPHWTVDSTDLEFVEIKATLQYEYVSADGTISHMEKKNLKKIVLGYSDEIHFIRYVGITPSCRVNLSHRFKNIA